jgi:hypothetical protein
VQVLIYMAIFIALDYYVLNWKEYQVVAKESHSETISIVTVRKSKSDLEGVLLSAYQQRAARESMERGNLDSPGQRLHKEISANLW